MPSTYSTNLAFELPASGEQTGTWGATVNTNVGTLIEQAISGYTTQAITDGADTSITIPNGATGVARNMFLELTGTLTAARNLIVPANKKLYFIYNNTTGGFAVTVKVSGQTGVSVPSGSKVLLVSNGTDVVVALNNVPITAFNGTVGATTPASGAFTTLSASSTVTINGVTTISSGQPVVNLYETDASADEKRWRITNSAGDLYLQAVNDADSVASTPLTIVRNGTTVTAIAFVGSSITLTGAVSASSSLSVGGTVSGAGITSLFAAPPNIGITTPAAGRFTAAYTTEVGVAFSAAAMTINCALSNVFSTTLSANVTTAPSFTNPADGQTINFYIHQDATGSRTMTWPSNFRWPGGVDGVLSTTANSVDLLTISFRSATASWYATLTKAFAV